MFYPVLFSGRTAAASAFARSSGRREYIWACLYICTHMGIYLSMHVYDMEFVNSLSCLLVRRTHCGAVSLRAVLRAAWVCMYMYTYIYIYIHIYIYLYIYVCIYIYILKFVFPCLVLRTHCGGFSLRAVPRAAWVCMYIYIYTLYIYIYTYIFLRMHMIYSL